MTSRVDLFSLDIAGEELFVFEEDLDVEFSIVTERMLHRIDIDAVRKYVLALDVTLTLRARILPNLLRVRCTYRQLAFVTRYSDVIRREVWSNIKSEANATSSVAVGSDGEDVGSVRASLGRKVEGHLDGEDAVR